MNTLLKELQSFAAEFQRPRRSGGVEVDQEDDEPYFCNLENIEGSLLL